MQTESQTQKQTIEQAPLLPNESNKSCLIAFLLSFLLGTFGAHRLYVGRKTSGLIMLISSILIIGIPVCTVINVIDWVKILLGSFKDAEGKVLVHWEIR